MVENIATTKSRGLDRMNEFLSRFSDSTNLRELGKKTTYYDSIKRENVFWLQSEKKQVPVTIPTDESKSFGEILSHFEGKKLNLRMIMDWPVSSKPYAIAVEDGKIRSNSKSSSKLFAALMSSKAFK